MNRQNKFYTEEQKEVFKFFKILLSLVVIVGLMYLFTNFVVNKEQKYKRTNNEGQIQYENIIIGQMLNRSDSEYYVLMFNSKLIDNSAIINVLSSYKTKKDSLPVYVVDLSNELNKNYVGTESKHSSDSIDDLTIKGSTLVKVEKGKMVKFIEGNNEIIGVLN